MSQEHIRLVDGGWDRELAAAIRADASEVCIVCPFIKKGALECFLSPPAGDIQVITRFNLNDFAEGVSDIEALRMLLDAGAGVRGIQNLHAKLYIFGASRAIITSANLTRAALTRNQEFGVVADDAAVIAACRNYFDALWQCGSAANLSRDMLDSWAEEVTRFHTFGCERSRFARSLGDFGAQAGFEPPQPVLPVALADAGQAFIKFLGNSKERKPISYPVAEVIQHEGCHRVLAYPQRPVSVEDGALMFMGRFTDKPNDIRIFGRGVGMRHRPDRDVASAEDIDRRSWREKYSRYIRVHHAEFVAGTLANGVSLNELMEALGSDSFAPTQRNAVLGAGNTDPRLAYRQQPAVELAPQGIFWLGERLQAAFDVHGTVPQDALGEIV